MPIKLPTTGWKTIRPIIYSGQNNNDLRDVNCNLNLLHTSVCFKLRKPVLNLATSCSKSLRHLSSLRENLKNACNIKKYNEMLLVIVINRILALFSSIVFLLSKQFIVNHHYYNSLQFNVSKC